MPEVPRLTVTTPARMLLGSIALIMLSPLPGADEGTFGQHNEKIFSAARI